jgi:glycosyltransferase involved in cell wall biosynthesis
MLSMQINNRGRVLMLVSNPCVNDSRVIKSAELLAGYGYKVCVICREVDSMPDSETRNNVSYVRVPMKFVLIQTNISSGHKQPQEKSVILILYKWVTKVTVACSQSLRKIAGLIIFFICYVLAIIIFITHKIIRPVVKLMCPRLEIIQEKYNYQNKFMIQVLNYKYASINNISIILLNLTKKFIGENLIQTVSTENIFEEAISFRPDIVHAHDSMIAASTGAKVIYDSHELETHRNGLKPLGRIQIYLKEKFYLKRTNAVITVCNSISDYLAKQYNIPKPTVIMNAPDVNRIDNNGLSLRDELMLTDATPLAVYVGKITTGRGLHELVRAMQFCKEFHVALLGPSVISIEENLTREAESLGVRDRLHLVPSVAPEIVMSYIKSADIGVIPIQDVCLSYRYCMPNKLFEMAFSGIPACVSNLPEMKAFIDRERVGITMDQTDPEDIARAMHELYQRRKDYVVDEYRLSELFKKYSWETQGHKLLNLYQNVLAVNTSSGLI